MSLAGGIGSAAIGAHAAGNAANAQVNAANYAATLQKQEADKNLAFQEQMWNTQQQNMAPWLGVGRNSLMTLSNLMGLPGYNPTPQLTPVEQARQNLGGNRGMSPTGTTAPGGPMMSMKDLASGTVAPGGPMMGTTQLGGSTARTSPGAGMQPGSTSTTAPGSPGSQFVPFAPWMQTFTPPTAADVAKTPGYQFGLDTGLQALDRSSAANGTILSGAGIKPYERYAQDYAGTKYNDSYNRALNEYELGYNQFENNQTQQWNRLASLSGLGQTSAAQLNSSGTATAGNVGNILLGLGSQLGTDANNAGAARASGYVGAGNAWAGGLSGGTNDIMQMLLLKQLMPGGSGTPFDPNSYGLANS